MHSFHIIFIDHQIKIIRNVNAADKGELALTGSVNLEIERRQSDQFAFIRPDRNQDKLIIP